MKNVKLKEKEPAKPSFSHPLHNEENDDFVEVHKKTQNVPSFLTIGHYEEAR